MDTLFLATPVEAIPLLGIGSGAVGPGCINVSDHPSLTNVLTGCIIISEHLVSDKFFMKILSLSGFQLGWVVQDNAHDVDEDDDNENNGA